MRSSSLKFTIDNSRCLLESLLFGQLLNRWRSEWTDRHFITTFLRRRRLIAVLGVVVLQVLQVLGQGIAVHFDRVRAVIGPNDILKLGQEVTRVLEELLMQPLQSLLDHRILQQLVHLARHDTHVARARDHLEQLLVEQCVRRDIVRLSFHLRLAGD